MSPVSRRALFGLAGTSVLVAAGCTSPDRPPRPTPTTPSSPPPSMPTTPPSVGLKWNWGLDRTLPWAGQQPPGGITFFEVDWCDLGGPGGQPNYAKVDELVNRARGLGFKMMLKLRAGQQCGAKAKLDRSEGIRKVPSMLPTDLAAYEAFVEGAVRHFSELGVDSYAVENEVDAKNFWEDTPEHYVTLATAAARAIRRANPEATVLDPGISSTGYGVAIASELLAEGKGEEALAVYTQWFARRHAGPQSRFPKVSDVAGLTSLLQTPRVRDAVAMVEANWEVVRSGATTAYQLHFYEGMANLPTLLTYLRRHLPRGLPVQGWEIGFAWPGPDFSGEAMAEELAALMPRLYGEGISPVVYLPLAFTPGPNKAEIFRGLLTPDGAPLPAAAVYDTVSRASAGATFTAIHSNGWQGAVLDGPQGRRAVVARTRGQGRVSGQAETLAGTPVDGTVSGTGGVVVTLPEAGSPAAAATSALGEKVSAQPSPSSASPSPGPSGAPGSSVSATPSP